ncbi:MAG TPA: nucleotide exchange factor GrpE [Gemmataceae bacterium]|nr:nucleotide exchange factor GrpE [Gemmataceae bacterium]
MPELPSPGVPQDPSERAAQALTPDAVAAVLADFRAWLMALTTEEQRAGSVSDEAAAVANAAGSLPRSPDLHTLLGQFVAVRQEVNLQTRAVRAQQEQNAETLRQLTAALDALRQSQTRGEEDSQQAIDEAVRPLLKTLIDLYDALALAGREMRRLRETMLPGLEQLAAIRPEPEPPPSLWARLFRSPAPAPEQHERQRLARDSAERVRQLLESLVTGYTMSLQRIERALRQHGLEPVPSAGERFDPERMEVVEAVAGSGRPSGEVVEEVRRGYLRNGRIFRFAQVRVAKS